MTIQRTKKAPVLSMSALALAVALASAQVAAEWALAENSFNTVNARIAIEDGANQWKAARGSKTIAHDLL